jgi:hypothetical protein
VVPPSGLPGERGIWANVCIRVTARRSGTTAMGAERTQRDQPSVPLHPELVIRLEGGCLGILVHKNVATSARACEPEMAEHQLRH